jgi:hypothetical protein
LPQQKKGGEKRSVEPHFTPALTILPQMTHIPRKKKIILPQKTRKCPMFKIMKKARKEGDKNGNDPK